MSETTQTQTQTPDPATTPLAGLEELLPPGVAQALRAEHDAAVGTLQALLAAARRDAWRASEIAATARLRADLYDVELHAARPVVEAARELVACWDRLRPSVSTMEEWRLSAGLADAVRALPAEEARRG